MRGPCCRVPLRSCSGSRHLCPSQPLVTTKFQFHFGVLNAGAFQFHSAAYCKEAVVPDVSCGHALSSLNCPTQQPPRGLKSTYCGVSLVLRFHPARSCWPKWRCVTERLLHLNLGQPCFLQRVATSLEDPCCDVPFPLFRGKNAVYAVGAL